MRNIADALRPGGVFVGTTTDAEAICSGLAGRESFGNPVFSVRCDPASWPIDSGPIDASDCCGRRYFFTLEGVVSDCPEFVLPVDVLVRLARAVGLRPLRIQGFAAFYEEMRGHRAHAERLVRMGVVDERTGAFLSEHERQVAELYLVFVFVRE